MQHKITVFSWFMWCLSHQRSKQGLLIAATLIPRSFSVKPAFICWQIDGKPKTSLEDHNRMQESNAFAVSAHQNITSKGNTPSIKNCYSSHWQQHWTALRWAELHICALPGGLGHFSGHVVPPEAEHKHRLAPIWRQINLHCLATDQRAV